MPRRLTSRMLRRLATKFFVRPIHRRLRHPHTLSIPFRSRSLKHPTRGTELALRQLNRFAAASGTLVRFLHAVHDVGVQFLAGELQAGSILATFDGVLDGDLAAA